MCNILKAEVVDLKSYQALPSNANKSVSLISGYSAMTSGATWCFISAVHVFHLVVHLMSNVVVLPSGGCDCQFRLYRRTMIWSLTGQ